MFDVEALLKQAESQRVWRNKHNRLTHPVTLSQILNSACVTASQDEREHDPETEAAVENSAIANFIHYISSLSTVTCQNVHCGIRLLPTTVATRHIKKRHTGKV